MYLIIVTFEKPDIYGAGMKNPGFRFHAILPETGFSVSGKPGLAALLEAYHLICKQAWECV